VLCICYIYYSLLGHIVREKKFLGTNHLWRKTCKTETNVGIVTHKEKETVFCKIWSFHIDEDSSWGLLGSDAV